MHRNHTLPTVKSFVAAHKFVLPAVAQYSVQVIAKLNSSDILQDFLQIRSILKFR